MKFKSNIQISSIYILESLDEQEAEGSQKLYTKLIELNQNKNLQLGYQNLLDIEHLFIVLEAIVDSTSKGDRPVIHFAMHGTNEGLELNGEIVKWKVLTKYLIEINLNMKNSLLLTFSVCYGAYVFEALMESPNRAPFSIAVASTDTINGTLIDNVFLLFYEKLFQNFDLDFAFSSIKEKYVIDLPFVMINSCEFLFDIIQTDITNVKTGKRRHKLIKHAKSKYSRNKYQEIKEKFRYNDNVMNLLKPFHENYLYEYLMCDLEKENIKNYDIDKMLFTLNKNRN